MNRDPYEIARWFNPARIAPLEYERLYLGLDFEPEEVHYLIAFWLCAKPGNLVLPVVSNRTGLIGSKSQYVPTEVAIVYAMRCVQRYYPIDHDYFLSSFEPRRDSVVDFESSITYAINVREWLVRPNAMVQEIATAVVLYYKYLHGMIWVCNSKHSNLNIGKMTSYPPNSDIAPGILEFVKYWMLVKDDWKDIIEQRRSRIGGRIKEFHRKNFGRTVFDDWIVEAISRLPERDSQIAPE